MLLVASASAMPPPSTRGPNPGVQTQGGYHVLTHMMQTGSVRDHLDCRTRCPCTSVHTRAYVPTLMAPTHIACGRYFATLKHHKVAPCAAPQPPLGAQHRALGSAACDPRRTREPRARTPEHVVRQEPRQQHRRHPERPQAQQLRACKAALDKGRVQGSFPCNPRIRSFIKGRKRYEVGERTRLRSSDAAAPPPRGARAGTASRRQSALSSKAHEVASSHSGAEQHRRHLDERTPSKRASTACVELEIYLNDSLIQQAWKVCIGMATAACS